MTLPPRVALVGFMGSGKSTVGKKLAEAMSREFFDTDLITESRLGLSIPEVFERHGEAFFRVEERRTVAEVVLKPNAVIATGGGTFANEECAQLLRGDAFVVHLDCDFAEAFSRVRDRPGRPLVARGESAVAALYAERKEKYAFSHATVDTTRLTPEEAVDAILKTLPRDGPN